MLDIISNKYNLQSVVEYYENNDIFRLLLDEKYDIFEKLVEWQDQSVELSKQIEFFKTRKQRYLYLYSLDKCNLTKKINEICEVNQGNSLTKTEMIYGIYDVIGGGKIIGKHNQKNRDGDDITLTRVGNININYIDKPYYLTDNGFSLKSKQKDIITKYIYYLLSHKDYLSNLYKGSAQKVISKTNLKSIKIPIPSIERQQEIVEYCECGDTLIKQLEKEIENNKKQAQQFITDILIAK